MTDSEDSESGPSWGAAIREVTRFSRDVPREARPLVFLAGILGLGAVGWLIGCSGRVSGPIAWLPAALLFGLSFLILAILSVRLLLAIRQDILINRDMIDTKAEQVIDAITQRPRPEALLLGCRIGRRSVSCGVLRIDAGDWGPLPGPLQYHQVGNVIRLDLDPSGGGDAIIDAAASVIADATRQTRVLAGNLTIEAVGIGLPGLVRISDKTVRGSPGLPDGTRLADEIAKQLLETQPDAAELLGGKDLHAIASRFHLDNDVRCAARRKLSSHLDEPGWENFVCLHVGSGVGAAMIFDRTLYYGTHGWAGEIGHIDLKLTAPLMKAVGENDFPPMKCTCGKVAYHFESLVNYNGLGLVARALDRAKFETIGEAFAQSDQRWQGERTLHDGWPLLLGAPATLDKLPDPVRQLVSGSDDYTPYFQAVLSTYAFIFCGALSTFVNVLDVDKIVLMGSLAESLHRHKIFDEAVRESMQRRLGRDDVERDYQDVEPAGWEGAALLGRDDRYAELSLKPARDRSERALTDRRTTLRAVAGHGDGRRRMTRGRRTVRSGASAS